MAGSSGSGVKGLPPFHVHPGHVFEGPVAVRHPLTIQGQGCTVRAPTGPALVIQSTGVILEDLTVEVVPESAPAQSEVG